MVSLLRWERLVWTRQGKCRAERRRDHDLSSVYTRDTCMCLREEAQLELYVLQ